MELKRILWPTDFSENAAKALPFVTSLAEKYGSEIHILYVMKDYQAFGAHYGDFDPDEQGRMKQMEKQLAEKRLDEICEKFLNQCPLFFRHILVGDPAAQILKFIDDHDIDFVVMASCGDEAHFDFGSVADRAVRCARVPVVTVPASDSCKLGA